ncbi:glycosyltransferase family 4 protein [Aquisediminimonas sediminicola]|uniref:glycosyltransferase family 4 protein n=1 Tax=Alteraquisediminimonas sediminicola TaxID=2676787 RepID=UPI001C8EBA35
MANSIFVVGARGIPDVEGGAEKNAERLFPLLVQRGWAVTLAGIRDNLHASHYRGVRLVGVPRSRLLRTDKLLYYVVAVWIMFRHRPALVHLQGLGAAIMLWAYKLAGARTVVRYGSADYLLPKWGWIGKCGFRLAEFQLRFADAVIAVTPALADRLARRGIRRNVHVIPNAIDAPEDFDNLADIQLPSKPYVLAVGRMTAQKNVERLVQGFNLFAKDHQDIMLVIAGGVDDPAYLAGLMPYLNDRIMLPGRLPRSALGALYRHASVYVNASIHEGCSNAVMEAMSWRTPVLISDIPENRDFGLHDHHYFDPLCPQALAQALAQALSRRDDFIVDNARFLRWHEVADRTSAIYGALGLVPMGTAN